MSDTIRKTVWFEGRVQGVGFRYTACDVAARLEVTGYVRNLPDGRVELAAEGLPGELSRLVAGVQAAMEGCIRRIESRDSPATGEFAGFRIRH